MRNLLLISYSVFVVIGLLLLLVFIPTQTPEYLGYGLPSSFLPNLLAVCIVFFSTIELIKTFLKKDDTRPSSVNTKNLLHLAKVSAVGFMAFPLMELITFIPAAFIIIALFQYLAGQRDYKYIIGLAGGLSITVYLAATYLLNVPLP